MTLGEFRKLTATALDSLPLLIPSFDHSFQVGDAQILIVTHEGRRAFSEHHESQELQPGQTLTQAIVIS